MTSHDGKRLTEDEFAERFSRTMGPLSRYALSVAGDPVVAEDVVGDAFLALMASLRRGVGPTAENFESYVRVSIRNEIVSQRRRLRHEIQVDDLTEVTDHSLPAYTPEVAEHTWNVTAIRAAFTELPTRSQQVLYLSEVEDRKTADIARLLGLSESSTYVVTHRAREALRVSYLVHTTPEDAVCGRFDRARLAAFARGRAPARRAENIENHLADCATCAATVRRMRALRLPIAALTVVGLSGSLAQVASLAPATPLQALITRLTTTRLWGLMGGSVSSPSALGSIITLVAAVVLVTGGVAVALSGTAGAQEDLSVPVDDGRGDTTVSAPAESDAQVQAGEPRGSQDAVADFDPAVQPDGSTTDSVGGGFGAQNLGSRLGLLPERENGEEGACLVPAQLLTASGPVSATWDAPSEDFLFGKPLSRIDLTVVNRGGGSDYRVEVLPGDGVAFDLLPAGCTRVEGVATCAPTAAQASAGTYTLSFTATVLPGADSRLPAVRVVTGSLSAASLSPS
ncbi:hypothetical protein GCM10022198_20250 [Klugiella xanthotipulae]|uniref:RNA polymerase sigma factor (Sigma-70 family) n=1 Tax=Klugiella xanthotipulae TaxID=244735 RepID=A0A543I638_9MICO|nr:sigma-70 family RNA polymerase sigma factor [Klugiella xanthotipulae]TQM66062.1 RNA polymerase sigma factor (sigma-70 family) [Klugiella xanthotipulae]